MAPLDSFSSTCSFVLISNCGFYNPRLYESLHIFQVDISGFPANPIGLFCKFSCQYIFLYFQGRFGALTLCFLDLHNQTIDEVRF
jgi:hypothetical protein